MSENKTREERFTFTNPDRVETIVAHYPDKHSAVLPLLQLAQSQEGFITPAVIETVAQIVDAHPAEIRDTASFYSQIYSELKGKYVIQICQTLPCSLNGADELVDHVCETLKIQPGETTEDGKFTVMKVECLGICDCAPVVHINSDSYEGMTPEKIEKLLESLL